MSDYEVPSDQQVVDMLQMIGGHTTAVELCRALVADGHPVLQSQLAIQRAAERGRIVINHDWSLSLAHEVQAA